MRVTMIKSANAVRVVLPATVAFDLGRFTKSMSELAERLGCKPCLSGVHCHFLLERDFLVDPAGRVRGDPSPQPNIFANLALDSDPTLVFRV